MCIYATKYNNNKINNHFFIIIIENLATHHPKLLPEKKITRSSRIFYRDDKNNQLSKNVVLLSKSIHYCEMELLYFLVSEKSASKFHTSNIATSIACTSFLQTESDGFAWINESVCKFGNSSKLFGSFVSQLIFVSTI